MPLKVVKATHAALRDDIGDLLTRRPLPAPGLDRLGAFLFLNHHGPQVYPPNNQGLPFGPHPHRGFETVTFVLQGELAHRDTGPLEILQLWVNLPARLKMSAPHYIGLQRDGIPALQIDDGKAMIHLVAGSFREHVGPIASLTGVMMSSVDMTPAARIRFDRLDGRDVFLYVVRGEVSVSDAPVGAQTLVELGMAGDAVEITARSDAVLLFGHADPIDEPVVSHGPFVMNSRAEIEQAIRDYQAGRFNAPAG